MPKKEKSSRVQTRELIAVEICHGAGGMALGAKRAGYKTVAAYDFDRYASETFRAAFPEIPEGEVHCLDINKVDWTKEAARFRKKFGPIDLVCGGPPCQSFSVAGRGLGKKDPRNGFPAFLEAVAAIEPRAVMIENVKGLTTKKHKPYLDKIVTSLEKLGYWVEWRVLNAANFGVPQIRQRVFIVGLRRDEVPGVRKDAAESGFVWPEETHSEAALVNAKWLEHGTEKSYWQEHGLPGPLGELSKKEKRIADRLYQNRVTAAGGFMTPPGESFDTELSIAKDKARWRTVRDAISDICHLVRPQLVSGINAAHEQAGRRPTHTVDETSMVVTGNDGGRSTPLVAVASRRKREEGLRDERTSADAPSTSVMGTHGEGARLRGVFEALPDDQPIGAEGADRLVADLDLQHARRDMIARRIIEGPRSAWDPEPVSNPANPQPVQKSVGIAVSPSNHHPEQLSPQAVDYLERDERHLKKHPPAELDSASSTMPADLFRGVPYGLVALDRENGEELTDLPAPVVMGGAHEGGHNGHTGGPEPMRRMRVLSNHADTKLAAIVPMKNPIRAGERGETILNGYPRPIDLDDISPTIPSHASNLTPPVRLPNPPVRLPNHSPTDALPISEGTVRRAKTQGLSVGHPSDGPGLPVRDGKSMGAGFVDLENSRSMTEEESREFYRIAHRGMRPMNHAPTDAIPAGPKSVTKAHPPSRLDSPGNAMRFGDRAGQKGIVELDCAAQVVKAGGNTDASGHLGGGAPPAIVGTLPSPAIAETPDAASTTISAGGTETGGADPIPHLKRQGYLRRLTPREAARLQSFPDWLVFAGTKTAAYRQVGNACPPQLAEVVARSIRNALESSKWEPLPTADVLAEREREGARPPSIQIEEGIMPKKKKVAEKTAGKKSKNVTKKVEKAPEADPRQRVLFDPHDDHGGTPHDDLPADLAAKTSRAIKPKARPEDVVSPEVVAAPIPTVSAVLTFYPDSNRQIACTVEPRTLFVGPQETLGLIQVALRAALQGSSVAHGQNIQSKLQLTDGTQAIFQRQDLRVVHSVPLAVDPARVFEPHTYVITDSDRSPTPATDRTNAERPLSRRHPADTLPMLSEADVLPALQENPELKEAALRWVDLRNTVLDLEEELGDPCEVCGGACSLDELDAKEIASRERRVALLRAARDAFADADSQLNELIDEHVATSAVLEEFGGKASFQKFLDSPIEPEHRELRVWMGSLPARGGGVDGVSAGELDLDPRFDQYIAFAETMPDVIAASSERWKIIDCTRGEHAAMWGTWAGGKK